MKAILLFILTLHCVSTLANSPRRDLLFCLGQEEQKLHVNKRTGPQYFLNQYFINEAASTGIFKLKNSYYEEICERREFPPSVGLMKNILINEKKIFEKVKMGSAHLEALYDSGLDTLVENAPHIFFQFLSIVQSHTRYAHCFKENIPELHSLMNSYQYLEEDTEPGQLIQNKKSIRIIFDKLKHLDAIYERCETKFKELQKKIKTN
ncbi:hypothetical protein [Halobacteriovorax sp. HLS]|uniref:hypothetical protein n=1 Tax=Halobacteriovorax sp. HLS TaxID=2234000 RepID=UPI000FDBE09C|nr:hypothetical protein [Halobacteriovorax sp. HLS]